MMWHEFEELAGYEVTFDDYNDFIEPMYMALNIPKQEFVKMVSRERFALPSPERILRKVRKEARHLFALCGHGLDYEAEKRMEEAAREYVGRKYGFDWDKDGDRGYYLFFENGYEIPEYQRGCTFPMTMVIGRGRVELERVKLQKN